jgi:hypothetical protein
MYERCFFVQNYQQIPHKRLRSNKIVHHKIPEIFYQNPENIFLVLFIDEVGRLMYADF